MPYQKTIAYNVTQRQFSILLKVPWDITPSHLKELKSRFYDSISQVLKGVDRVTLRLFKSSSMCRFTIIFTTWQGDVENISKYLEQTAKEVIKHL